MASAGEPGNSKSKRKKRSLAKPAKKPSSSPLVVAFNFADGNSDVYGLEPGEDSRFSTRQKVTAADLCQANLTRREDIQNTIFIESDVNSTALDSRVINYLVCTEIDDGYSPEEVALSLQELHDRGAGEVQRTGGTETAGIIGAVHQTFVQTVPSHFKIVLAGAKRTITVKAPPALKNANVNVTVQNKLSIELDPAELDFQPGSTVTPWYSYHEFKATFDIPIPPESMEKFYFRYRIVNAVSDSAKQKLRAEMLFLPPGKTLLGLPPDVMNMVREPAIPAVMVAVVEQPILWFGGDTAAQSKQFTTLISQVFVSNPWERQEFMMPDQGYPPAEEAFKKPVLSSVLHARLLYEITKLFAQCPAESIAGTPLKNFWNDVDKNRAKVIETEPDLRLAARPCKEEEQNLPFNAGLLWAKSLRRFAQARRYSKNAAISDEMVENLDNFATAAPRDRGSGALQHRPSFTESPPRSQNKQLAYNGPSCSVRKRNFPRGEPPPFSKSATEVAVTGFPAKYKPSTAPLAKLKRMPDLEFMAGDTDDEEVERENFTPKEFVISCLTGGEISAGVKVPAKERLHTELVPMYFAPDDTVDPESQRDYSVNQKPQAVFIYDVHHPAKKFRVGSLKNIADRDTFDIPSGQKAAEAIAEASDFASVYWHLQIEVVTLTHCIPLEEEDYIKFGIPIPSCPLPTPERISRASDAAASEADSEIDQILGAGHPAPLTGAKKAAALADLKRLHNEQNHFFQGSAADMATMVQTRTRQQARGSQNYTPGFASGPAANQQPAGSQPPPHFTQQPGAAQHGGGGGGGGRGPPGGGGGGDGGGGHGGEHTSRKKKKRRDFSESSDSSGDERHSKKQHRNSGDDFNYSARHQHHCRGRQCDQWFYNYWEKEAHEAVCQLLDDRTDRKEPWGRAANDLDKYDIRLHKREFPAAYDDNINTLHPARWMPMSVGWHIPHAAQPIEAKPARFSYPFTDLGMIVNNRRLMINMHYMGFSDYSLSMMTAANLKRANVRYTQKTEKRDSDEIALKESRVEQLILALNNYRVIMRLMFPGYLGAEAFFKAWLERLLDKDLPPLTAAELNEAFVEHLNKKATAATEGTPPPNYTEVQAASDKQATKEHARRLAALESRKDDQGSGGGANRTVPGGRKGGGGGRTPNPPRVKSYTAQNTGGYNQLPVAAHNYYPALPPQPPAQPAARGRGGGRSRSRAAKPSNPQPHNFCFGFNSQQGCQGAQPGGICNKHGSRFDHRCANVLAGGDYCGERHSSVQCPN